jgi:hypothetical protein
MSIIYQQFAIAKSTTKRVGYLAGPLCLQMEDLVREERKEESRGVEEAIALPDGFSCEPGKGGVFTRRPGAEGDFSATPCRSQPKSFFVSDSLYAQGPAASPKAGEAQCLLLRHQLLLARFQ